MEGKRRRFGGVRTEFCVSFAPHIRVYAHPRNTGAVCSCETVQHTPTLNRSINLKRPPLWPSLAGRSQRPPPRHHAARTAASALFTQRGQPPHQRISARGPWSASPAPWDRNTCSLTAAVGIVRRDCSCSRDSAWGLLGERTGPGPLSLARALSPSQAASGRVCCRAFALRCFTSARQSLWRLPTAAVSEHGSPSQSLWRVPLQL